MTDRALTVITELPLLNKIALRKQARCGSVNSDPLQFNYRGASQ